METAKPTIAPAPTARSTGSRPSLGGRVERRRQRFVAVAVAVPVAVGVVLRARTGDDALYADSTPDVGAVPFRLEQAGEIVGEDLFDMQLHHVAVRRVELCDLGSEALG